MEEPDSGSSEMPPTPEAVRLALERVIASAPFRQADSLTRFLRYTVEAALSRPSVPLKEYTVAVEALGRPPSFDPRADSIVRVLARKLREKLARYYAHEGRQDGVRFAYSRGSYVPRIDVTSAAGEARTHTVAVLPFLNLSADHDAAYFSDGLTEEVMFLLSRTAKLRVVARTSCFRFKGSAEDAREIGRTLGAELLVEGGVRLAADRLRVTARLVSAADGLEIWSDRYERTLDDVLRVQEEIAESIAGALRVQAAPRPQAADIEAHNLYLKGRYFWNQRTEEGFRRALDFYQAAVARDPAMARAHAGIAETNILMMMHGVAEPIVVMPAAREAAMKALASDPELGAARSSLAAIHMLEQDVRAVETEWLRAIRSDPAYATAHHWYGVFGLVLQRRFDEAIAVIREAERLDPLSLPIASDAAFVLYWSRRYDEAIEQCRRALFLDRSFYRAHITLGRVHAATRQYSEAIEACLTARTLCDGRAFLAQLLGTLGYSYALAGERERALGVLDELRTIAPANSVAEYEMGIVHAALGEWAAVRTCIEAARARRTGWMAWLGVEPLYDGVNARVHV
jgi:TolB-like protein/Flp pilus assembly protein TadD